MVEPAHYEVCYLAMYRGDECVCREIEMIHEMYHENVTKYIERTNGGGME